MFFESLLPAFKDHRYIKVDGKPLFYVFSPTSMPQSYMDCFNRWIKECGFPGLYWVANINKLFVNKDAFISRGFDAVSYQRLQTGVNSAGEMSPNLFLRGYRKLKHLLKGYLMHRPPFMEEYRRVAKSFVTSLEEKEDVIPVIVPQWDHTPRSGWNGTLLVNARPEYFKEVAIRAIRAVAHKPEQKQIIFLKSWNEWGEGNYMEPDISHGRGYLEALHKAIEETRND